jgi:hypothetical protein
MKNSIIKTHEFNVIEEEIRNADYNSLVVFDVDDVLITPRDKVLNENQYIYETIEGLLGESKPSDILELYSIIFLGREAIRVDNRFVSIISELQKNKIKVVALTNCNTEKFYHIDSMKDWRIKELQSLGYNFGISWKKMLEHKFENLPTYEEGVFPVFKDGILFTNDVSKGEVLAAFLKYANLNTNSIYFIDDNIKYLESVAEVAKKLSISYVGIEYDAVKTNKKSDFCKEVSKKQIEILVKEKRWVSKFSKGVL